ncbi:MAG: ABC transporter permease [Synergistaceae bacterium]|jgi:NitT/TauT family transport system permease protein|nr:ABC transporter permease [Synergistaceae bacterium]
MQRCRKIADLLTVIAAFLILWEAAVRAGWVKEFLFPPPERVFVQLFADAPKLLTHIRASLGLVLHGYALGLAAAIPLGLLIGGSTRAGTTATLISKFLASIPPIVYIPYGVALLPTFRSVSVMVIFLATFWPVLSATVAGVLYTERKYIDAAKVQGHGKWTVLFRVILPGALPQIFTGCNQGLSVSFILLTSAEMIGARNGMGYYVNYFSDLGDYKRTIVGVIVIGTVISLVFFAFGKLQKHMLRWRV